mmetsp:Transcript_46777/g.84472  ORF Transcript_46777/g.84472 Transcript_46777/m.84472 type:complete len:311 (-) Transcript_46777:67-999(-)
MPRRSMMSGLRYPAALDLPSEAMASGSGRDMTSTADSAMEEPGTVSIDRRLFRRLKRPGSSGPKKVGPRAGSDALYTFGPPSRNKWSDEDWLATTSYGSYDGDEADGASAVRLGGRHRLAGNNLQEFEDYLDDYEDDYDCELDAPLDADIEMQWVQPRGSQGSRSMSSPDLRMQKPPRCMQPGFLHENPRYARPERYATEYGYQFEQPPWQDRTPYHDAAWLTPERRKPRAVKSDPVSRGAQLRGMWQRDRFLRSSPSRKFDLRRCGGNQAFELSARRPQPFIPSYVPPHEKRRDEVRLQVRLQMREADF